MKVLFFFQLNEKSEFAFLYFLESRLYKSTETAR